jgi:hypothetical protein
MERQDDILRRCAFPGLDFELLFQPGNGTFLRVRSQGPCNVTGERLAWTGRKWRMSPHMTDGEVVQTAFLAVMTAIEHETREQFKFDGVSVFDPHYDIHRLVELRRQGDSIKERAPSPTQPGAER